MRHKPPCTPVCTAPAGPDPGPPWSAAPPPPAPNKEKKNGAHGSSLSITEVQQPFQQPTARACKGSISSWPCRSHHRWHECGGSPQPSKARTAQPAGTAATVGWLNWAGSHGHCKGTPPAGGRTFTNRRESADLACAALQHLTQVQVARPHQVVGSVPQHAVHLCRSQQCVRHERGLRHKKCLKNASWILSPEGTSQPPCTCAAQMIAWGCVHLIVSWQGRPLSTPLPGSEQHRESSVVVWQALILPNPWLLLRHAPTSTWSVRGVEPS